MKKIGPKKRFLNVEEREAQTLERVDPGVRRKLKERVDEFKDDSRTHCLRDVPQKGTSFTRYAQRRARNPLVGRHTD